MVNQKPAAAKSHIKMLLPKKKDHFKPKYARAKDKEQSPEERLVDAQDSVWAWSEWTADPNDPCYETRERIMISSATCGGNPNDPLLS